MMDTSLWKEWTNEHVQRIKHKQLWYPNSLFLMSPSHFPYEFLGRRKGPSLLLHEVDIHIHTSSSMIRCQKPMWLYCWHHLLRRGKLLYFGKSCSFFGSEWTIDTPCVIFFPFFFLWCSLGIMGKFMKITRFVMWAGCSHLINAPRLYLGGCLFWEHLAPWALP